MRALFRERTNLSPKFLQPMQESTLALERRNVGTERHKVVRDLLVLGEHVGTTQKAQHVGTALTERVQLPTDGLEFCFDLCALLLEIAAPLLSDSTVEREQLLK